MRWVSNGDPPLYVWRLDIWYDQKTKRTYQANPDERKWWSLSQTGFTYIDFPKKSRVMN